MARQLDAVYEHGVLRPLEPLALNDNQKVRLTLDENAPDYAKRPSTRLSWEAPDGEPVNKRRDELRWLAKDSGSYAGEWVALDGPRLIAPGDKLSDVLAAASTAVVGEPFFARVPRAKDV